MRLIGYGLPPTDAAGVRALLSHYLDQRVSFYLSRDQKQLREINMHTAQLQNELWSAVQVPAAAEPNAIVALTVSGMNDVLNTQGYTQAAWWNRIPHAAWSLMACVAIVCNLLVGYGARRTKRGGALLVILPLIVSIAFLLIADIDSPRGGANSCLSTESAESDRSDDCALVGRHPDYLLQAALTTTDLPAFMAKALKMD